MAWVIRDDEGVIHRGTEEEMGCAMRIMTWHEKTLKSMHQEERLAALKELYRRPFTGKLIMEQEDGTREDTAQPSGS